MDKSYLTIKILCFPRSVIRLHQGLGFLGNIKNDVHTSSIVMLVAVRQEMMNRMVIRRRGKC